MPDNWAPKNHKMIIEQQKSPATTINIGQNDLGPVNNPYLDQFITIKKAKLGPVNNFTAYVYIYML